ncbi:MAG: YceI family protein [Chitinophagaceae bacterium]|jgi:hypothetical protein|nr:YceI family protein [Chitinophagaceae bacterium]
MKKLTLVALVLAVVTTAFTQTAYRSVSINIVIAGTSTLHDWEMKSSSGSVQASFATDAAGKPTALAGLTFSMTATSLKSGKESMDNNAYKALSTKTADLIRFSATSGTVTPAGGTNYTVRCNGVMTIAGRAMNTDLTATITVGADGSYSVSGVKAIKMTQYGVKPPTFMMGAIKTGDDLTINFKTLLRP